MILKILSLFFIFGYCHGMPITYLYGPNDHVVELTPGNHTAIFNSDQLWIVEFYAHWCGYCIRFAPTWMKVAEAFKDWKDSVKIAAFNCAEYDCSAFDIQGTPTMRVFKPHTPIGSLGEDVNTKDFWQLKWHVLDYIQKSQAKGSLQELPNIVPFKPLNSLEVLMKVAVSDPKLSAFILDYAPSVGRSGLGRSVQLEFGDDLPENDLIIYDVPFIEGQQAFPSLFSGALYFPAVLVMQSSGDKAEVFFPSPTATDSAEKQIKDFLIKLVDKYTANDQQTTTIPTTTTVSTTTEVSQTGSSPLPIEEQKETFSGDVVHAVDIEKAIKYSIMREIPNSKIFSREEMSVIYNFLDVLVSYAPVRQEIKDFLTSLREYPVRANLRIMTGQSFKEKAEELSRIYKPFEATPNEWKLCQGSEPQFRGYPCALWTTFHSLMANAAVEGDPAFSYGGTSTVANTMVGYIKNFFSCKYCADNFAMKVQTLGFLPTKKQDSVLWLWQIHNMANKKLKGDPTEDPQHPKIVWPTPENCPECRASGLKPSHISTPTHSHMPVSIQGELWYIDNVAKYLIKVYRTKNVIPNTNTEVISKKRREKKMLELQDLMTETITRLNATDESGVALNLPNLLTINNYCSNLFNYTD